MAKQRYCRAAFKASRSRGQCSNNSELGPERADDKAMKARKSSSQFDTLGIVAIDDKRADRASSASGHPWTKDDAKWFRSNPLRDFRLRSAFPGECPDHPEVDQVLVRQIAPGKRTRMMGVATGDGTWLTDRELLIMWFGLLNCSEGTTRYLLFSPPDEGAV